MADGRDGPVRDRGAAELLAKPGPLQHQLVCVSWYRHDTDSYNKISRVFVEGQRVGNFSRESVVDNITLYWLTGTGASAARWYWETGRAGARAAGQTPPPVKVPVGFTAFPGEIFPAPRSWVEVAYPGLAYFNAADRGGHFAAWEEPALFAAELRAAFKPLR